MSSFDSVQVHTTTTSEEAWEQQPEEETPREEADEVEEDDYDESEDILIFTSPVDGSQELLMLNNVPQKMRVPLIQKWVDECTRNIRIAQLGVPSQIRERQTGTGL